MEPAGDHLLTARRVRFMRHSRGHPELGHHARLEMRHVMAMQHPVRGLPRIQSHCDHGHWWHIDRIAPRARKAAVVDANNLEGMTMQMHRMPHHRHVVEH